MVDCRETRAAWITFLCGLVIGLMAQVVGAQVSGVRTEISARQFVNLHSYTMGEYDGDLMFFGGMARQGLHSLARDGRATFPNEAFNRRIHCFDSATGTTYSGGIDHLGPTLRGALVATNAQSVQYGDTLYIYGGYGPVQATVSWATHDTIIAINLSPVHSALILNQPVPADAFTVMRSSAAQVAGGQIVKLGDRFALVGGANFTGNYGDEMNFHVAYSEAIHVFDSNVSFTQPVVSRNDAQFHRRDGNVSPITLGSGLSARPGFLVHIGVFKPGREVLPEVWEHPLIYDSMDDSVRLDSDFTQMMNQYEAPTVSFHSERRAENYIVTLGGLSGANWDGQNFIPNVVIPWVDDVTMLTARGGQVVEERVVGRALKPLTNSELVLSDALPTNELGQVLWDDLTAGEVLLGHFYGGLEAANPGNSANTRASEIVYAVYATIEKFSLEVSELRAGEEAELSVSMGESGAPVIFAYSTRGSGPTYIPTIGLSVDLSQPVNVLGRANADVNGEATLRMQIPAGAPATDVYLQAITREDDSLFTKSNLVVRRIER